MRANIQAFHEVVHVMGIPVHITGILDSREMFEVCVREATARLKKWDEHFSRFKTESELAHLNAKSGKWVRVSPEMFFVLEKCLRISEETHGVFDASVGSYLAAAGYGLPKTYSLPRVVPTYKNIQLNAKEQSVHCAEGQILEPAAIVKGMAMDDAATALQEMHGYMINAGGDILTYGKYLSEKAWTVGVQDPDDSRAIVATLPVSDCAVSTSGNYEVKKGTWHHQISLQTGLPVNDWKSITVVAYNAEEADKHTSIAFLLGKQNGLSYLLKTALPFFALDASRRVYKHGEWQLPA